MIDEGGSFAQMIAAHVAPGQAVDDGEQFGGRQDSTVLNLRPDEYVVELDLERTGRQQCILQGVRQEERH